MTQDEIIELATEAGLCSASNGFVDWIDAGPSLHEMTLFAKLVADKERDAIWNIIFEYAGRDDLTSEDESLLKHLADLIKARGNT